MNETKVQPVAWQDENDMAPIVPRTFDDEESPQSTFHHDALVSMQLWANPQLECRLQGHDDVSRSIQKNDPPSAASEI